MTYWLLWVLQTRKFLDTISNGYGWCGLNVVWEWAESDPLLDESRSDSDRARVKEGNGQGPCTGPMVFPKTVQGP